MPLSLLPLLEPTEYIGALSDLTGEIGRVGVLRAANRDVATVSQALSCCTVVASALMLANSSGRFGKKVEAAQNTCKKLEEISYEMSMAARGRSRAVDRDSGGGGGAGAGGGGGDEE